MEKEIKVKEIDFSNRLYKLVTKIILLAIIVSAFAIYLEFQKLPENTNYPETITVQAQGKATVKPDIASIKIGISTDGKKVEEITTQNNDKMNKILANLKALGIEERDLQTTNYSLSPQYWWNKDGQRFFQGYTLTQEVMVKIRDFAKIGKAIETATTGGANITQDLQFIIDDQEKIKEIARKDAIEKAKNKARQIATLSGFKLGKIINYYEDNYYPGPIMMKESAGAGNISSSIPAPDIQPGTQEITVTINLVYKIK